MKFSKFLLAVFFCLISLKGFSQDESVSQLNFIVKAGAVMSEFSNGQPHTGQKLGFTAGVNVAYRLNDLISVQAEPAYLQQGGTFTRFSDDSRFGDASSISAVYTTTNNITTHNVDLPVMAKFHLPQFGDIDTYAVIGPSVTYNFYTGNEFERTYHYNQTFSTVSGYEVVTREYEKFQYGATAGIGGAISVGSRKLYIDLRYKYGITPVKKSYSYIDIYQVSGDLHTNSYYFTIGLGI